jgi:hypothetical protein
MRVMQRRWPAGDGDTGGNSERSGGKTYSQLSAESLAQPGNQKDQTRHA